MAGPLRRRRLSEDGDDDRVPEEKKACVGDGGGPWRRETESEPGRTHADVLACASVRVWAMSFFILVPVP